MKQLYSAEYFIRALDLEPHVEGGYCRELFKSPQIFGERPLSSTIYYLLKAGQVSRFHRLKSDELWFFHCGDPLLIHQIDSRGNMATERLGLEVSRKDKPQIAIAAGNIFGAELSARGSFCLVSCMVSPGFDYQDFEIFTEEYLLAKYPQHQAVINRLNGS